MLRSDGHQPSPKSPSSPNENDPSSSNGSVVGFPPTCGCDIAYGAASALDTRTKAEEKLEEQAQWRWRSRAASRARIAAEQQPSWPGRPTCIERAAPPGARADVPIDAALGRVATRRRLGPRWPNLTMSDPWRRRAL